MPSSHDTLKRRKKNCKRQTRTLISPLAPPDRPVTSGNLSPAKTRVFQRFRQSRTILTVAFVKLFETACAQPTRSLRVITAY